MHFDELARITGGRLRRPETGAELFRGVSHDSRMVASGQLFIAVRGQRARRHKFHRAAQVKTAGREPGRQRNAHRQEQAAPPRCIQVSH